MLEKIKTYQPKIEELIRTFQDVRAVGMVAFGVVAVLIAWSSVKIIETNYTLQRDIAELKQQNEVRELQNRNLKLQNQYYETDEYLELEARRNFGLAAPGETVFSVPRTTAERYIVEQPPTRVATVQAEQGRKSNSQAWLDFFLHRQ